MKKILFCAIALFSLSSLLKAQEQIPLYHTTDFPFSKTDVTVPTLTVFKPQGNPGGTAVIVCSGGSYGRRANEEEGTPVCQKLVEAGITAFLLDYRLPNGHDSIPFADVQAAVRLLRENAAVYHIRKDRIGIMGFSAGGHLASTITTHFNEHFDNSDSPVSVRPDFSVLVYPVISMTDELTHTGSRYNLLGKTPSDEEKEHFSNELQVTDQTPPVFIVHAVDDGVVKVANTLYFAAALRQHRVSVEMFIYAKGGHGFGVDNRTVQVQWVEPCIKWIKDQK
ncbi:MAG: alpha/beta hydrolase [Mucilaginibacter sp.]|nr:alpha/beta hydrolase [Mucilaginibacter sp.]